MSCYDYCFADREDNLHLWMKDTETRWIICQWSECSYFWQHLLDEIDENHEKSWKLSSTHQLRHFLFLIFQLLGKISWGVQKGYWWVLPRSCQIRGLLQNHQWKTSQVGAIIYMNTVKIK